jgi:ATP-dependent Clp protease adapter protein ClpS
MANEPDKNDQEQDGTDAVHPDDASVATETEAAPPKPGTLPPHKVLLHNDDVNEFTYVIAAITRLTPLSREEAIQRTIEAHETGVALLMVTHKERAELVREQFASCSLTVTIEPA